MTDQPAHGPDAPAPAAPLIEAQITAGGATVAFRIAEGTAGPFFCLGVRKSGSSLLNRIVATLARVNGVHAVDIPGTMFRRGLLARDWTAVDVSPLLRPGNLYLGWRTLAPGLAAAPAFAAGRKVLMVRDPRDALVSQYFSDAFSHALPGGQDALGPGRAAFLAKRERVRAMTIDAFVLEEARVMARTLAEYEPLLQDPACLVLQYEAELFLKRRLVARVARHFGWRAPPGPVEKLMAEVDAIPATEDPDRFVRQALPGDHRRKLQPETLRALDRRLAPTLERWGYA